MAFPQTPVSILVNVGIQAGQSATGGAFSIFPGTNIVNVANAAASVVGSSATLNAGGAALT